MIGVGKSTLAHAISNNCKMELVSEASLGISYLDRLFKNPSRWGYEAQVAFLIGKVNEIKKLENKQKPYVIDRSITEDATIFFEYFKDANDLDELTCLNYRMLYEFISECIPPEDIVIICTADYESVLKRVSARNKFKNFVEGYLESIFNRYEKYISDIRGNPKIYICDGMQFDWTKKEVCKLVIDDIENLLNKNKDNSITTLNILRAHI